ncbi:hypothetical protein ACFL6H_09825, partial [Candidatus Latescibacterota bacterium]
TIEITELPEGMTEEYALSLFEKKLGITSGKSRMVNFELPSINKSVAKAASPLSAELDGDPVGSGAGTITQTTTTGTTICTFGVIAGGTTGGLIVGGAVGATVIGVGGATAAAGGSHDQGSIN